MIDRDWRLTNSEATTPEIHYTRVNVAVGGNGTRSLPSHVARHIASLLIDAAIKFEQKR